MLLLVTNVADLFLCLLCWGGQQSIDRPYRRRIVPQHRLQHRRRQRRGLPIIGASVRRCASRETYT